MIETKFYAENLTNHNLHVVGLGFSIPARGKIEVNQSIAIMLENNSNIVITRAREKDGEKEQEVENKEFKENSKVLKAKDKIIK